MKITIYSSETCAYCGALMDWLDRLGIDYEERDANAVDYATVPVTVIDETEIVGFDRPEIKRVLKQKGINC